MASRVPSSIYWPFLLSFFVAFVLSVLQVPADIFYFWPDWIVLLVIFWALVEPDRVGPWTGLLIGLLMEVLLVRTFGVYALGVATLVYVVNRFHLQFKVLSVWQQMVLVGVLIGIFKLLTAWVYGLVSGFVISADYFYSLVGDVVAWPFLSILLREFRQA